MPNFELTDEGNLPYGLFEYLKRAPVVLVFYRGDWCPYCNGQLVSFARNYKEFEDRGFIVAGVSVDPPSRNIAMVQKLDLPFRLLSDPRGELAKRLGLWNEEEGVAEPTIVVLDRTGTVRYLYSGGKDFSDRPPLEDLFKALKKVDSGWEPGEEQAEIQVTPEEAENETVRPDRPAAVLEELIPYYRGAYFTTVAMKKKLGGRASREVDAYQHLVKEYAAAIQETAG